MIRVKLQQAMDNHRMSTGERMTYGDLAEISGVAEATLNSIGSRLGYQPNLATVEKICRALKVPLHDMLEMIDDPPKSKRKRKSKAKKKKS